MTILKKILFPLFSIFLGYQTFDVMRYLLTADSVSFSTIEALITSFIISLFTTGIFAFVGFVYRTHKLLPKAYYQTKNASVLNRTYNALGVKYFRILLMFAFWGTRKNRAKYFNGKRSGFSNFIYQTKQSEFGHFGALLLITALSITLLSYGYIKLFAFTTIINVIGNFYPIILQRKHRLRIQEIIKE